MPPGWPWCVATTAALDGPVWGILYLIPMLMCNFCAEFVVIGNSLVYQHRKNPNYQDLWTANVVRRMVNQPPCMSMSVCAVLNCRQTGVISLQVTTTNGSISNVKINLEKWRAYVIHYCFTWRAWIYK
jgi:hypothetical protein